jgi:hypothetical protein
MFQVAAKRSDAGTQVVSSDMNLSADASTQVVQDDMNLSSKASTEVKPADLTLTCDGHTQTDTRYVTTSEKAVEVTKRSYFDKLLLQDDICVSS